MDRIPTTAMKAATVSEEKPITWGGLDETVRGARLNTDTEAAVFREIFFISS